TCKNKQWELTLVSCLKISQQLDDAFLEDPEALDSVGSNSEDEPGPPSFCSKPLQIVEEDSKDDGYEEFRRRLGMELTEPVPCREHKNVRWAILCVLFMLSLITALRKSFLKIVRAAS
ncbi:hypothetical protein G0U57_007502, partial [Chelydra serpentina]